MAETAMVNKLEKNIDNFSSYYFSTAEKLLLTRGFTFVPAPRKFDKTIILRATTDFGRRLKLKHFFLKQIKFESKQITIYKKKSQIILKFY